MKRAVFFDRDGVINQAVVKNGRPYPPENLESLQLNEGITQVARRASGLGYLLFVFTNQPDVARGTQTRAEVERINEYLCSVLPLTKVYCCFHDNEDDCQCRKPRPGMLLQAAEEHNVDLKNSIAVGDRWRDIDAGKAAGCKTIFLDHGYNEELRARPDHTVQALESILPLL